MNIHHDAIGTTASTRSLRLLSEEYRRRDPLSGKRVAITGGTSGLGFALLGELLNRGAQVAFVARRRDGVQRAMEAHPPAHGVRGDVSKKEDIYPIAIQVLGVLGGVDVLINNASDLGPTPLA